MFGKEPIHQIIRQNPRAGAREILTSSFNAFNVFLGDRAPEDDVTLVVIKITKDYCLVFCVWCLVVSVLNTKHETQNTKYQIPTPMVFY